MGWGQSRGWCGCRPRGSCPRWCGCQHRFVPRNHLDEVDDLVTVAAAPNAKVAAGIFATARLAIGEPGIIQVEGDLEPLASIVFRDDAGVVVDVASAVVLQFPLIVSLIQVSDVDDDSIGAAVDIAIIDIEIHVRIVTALVGAAGITAFRGSADIPKGHRFAAGHIIVLVKPELVVAPLWEPLVFGLAQGGPDAGGVSDGAAEVLVGEFDQTPTGLIHDLVIVQEDIVGVFVQAVVKPPHGGSDTMGRVRLSPFPCQRDLISPFQHGIILAGLVRWHGGIVDDQSTSAVRGQPAMLQANPVLGSVVGNETAFLHFQIARREFQE